MDKKIEFEEKSFETYNEAIEYRNEILKGAKTKEESSK